MGEVANWAVSLFPSLPLALLALIGSAEAPGLVLVEEESVLNVHVSAASVARSGFVIRTFDQYAARPRFRGVTVKASPVLAVHQSLEALNTRLGQGYDEAILAVVPNHIENLVEGELPRFLGTPSGSVNSATVAFGGCPGAVGLLSPADDRALVVSAAAALGLTYEPAAEFRSRAAGSGSRT